MSPSCLTSLAPRAPVSPSLFHLNIVPSSPLLHSLHSVRVILLCGPSSRASLLQTFFTSTPAEPLFPSSRYSIFLPTPNLLIASHGMGCSSLSILLSELHTALILSGNQHDPLFIRVGSCGGLGVSPGTGLIASSIVDGGLRAGWETWVLGERRMWETAVDEELVKKLEKVEGWESGTIMCAETFYEGQGRLDGGNGGFVKGQREKWLRGCAEKGVRAMEMEGLALASFGKRERRRVGMVCVVLVDRLIGETPATGKGDEEKWEKEFVQKVVTWVKIEIGMGQEGK